MEEGVRQVCPPLVGEGRECRDVNLSCTLQRTVLWVSGL